VGGGVKSGRRVMLISSLTSVSRLYAKCENLDVSEPYRPPRPVTGIALLFLICKNVSQREFLSRLQVSVRPIHINLVQ
jgi:hypothetical protein